MTSTDGIRFVFFDAGGTMLRVHPSVGEVYSRTAAEHGFSVPAPWLDERFRGAWKDSLRRSRERAHRCSDEILRSEWFTIVRETFGDRVPEPGLALLFEDLYEQFVSEAAWTLAGEARETFERLRSAGLRLGVLSNWDSRLPRTLRRLDIADAFDVTVISYDVGWEKPHQRIFEEAVARSGEPPCRILHVGDSWETDIEPARRIGMRTLWLASAAERSRRPDPGPGADDFRALSAGDWSALITGADGGPSRPR